MVSKVNSVIKGAIILRGVPQGCILTSVLVNMYSEQIFQESLAENTESIFKNGENVNNLQYADDNNIFAVNLLDFQNFVERINMNCNKRILEEN